MTAFAISCGDLGWHCHMTAFARTCQDLQWLGMTGNILWWFAMALPYDRSCNNLWWLAMASTYDPICDDLPWLAMTCNNWPLLVMICDGIVIWPHSWRLVVMCDCIPAWPYLRWLVMTCHDYGMTGNDLWWLAMPLPSGHICHAQSSPGHPQVIPWSSPCHPQSSPAMEVSPGCGGAYSQKRL